MEKKKPSAKKRYRTRESLFYLFPSFQKTKWMKAVIHHKAKNTYTYHPKGSTFLCESNWISSQHSWWTFFSVVFLGVTDCDSADQFQSVANGNILTLPFICAIQQQHQSKKCSFFAYMTKLNSSLSYRKLYKYLLVLSEQERFSDFFFHSPPPPPGNKVIISGRSTSFLLLKPNCLSQPKKQRVLLQFR